MTASYRATLTVVGSLAAAAAFGTVEQLLSLHHSSSFLAAVGGMTAPWLLVPFLIGVAHPRHEGNALLGLAAVWLAISEYSAGAETGGDFTGDLTPGRIVSYLGAFGISHLPVPLGATVSGPVYAVLGHRWRLTRSWLPALAVTAPVMLEPAVRWVASQSILFWAAYPPVAWAETLTGFALTAAAIVISARGGARGWPGRIRRSGPRGLFACLARRTAAIAGIAMIAAAAIVFCAPPVIPQVYPAGNGTVGVVVSPDGRTFYAVVYNDSTSWVSSVNLRTGARARIAVPGGADTIALSPGGRTLYVSDYRNAIVPVSTATRQAGRPIRLPADDEQDTTADYLAVAPDGRIIYLGLNGQSDAEVTGIDIATGAALPWAYHVGDLGSLLLAPHGRTLYLGVPGGSCDEYLVSGTCQLVAVNAATGHQEGGSLPLNDEPLGMTATPDGRNLFIIGKESVTETRLTPDGAPTSPVAVPDWGRPNTGFAMSPDGSTLYVSVSDGTHPGGLSFVRL